MKGSMKNQTVKHWYTIYVEDDDGIVIDTRRVFAESAREALVLAYSFLANMNK